MIFISGQPSYIFRRRSVDNARRFLMLEILGNLKITYFFLERFRKMRKNKNDFSFPEVSKSRLLEKCYQK